MIKGTATAANIVEAIILFILAIFLKLFEIYNLFKN